MPAKNLTRINDEETYLHIYNTGVEGRIIFNDESDYQVFGGFLKEYLTPQDSSSIKKDFKIDGKSFQGVPHLPKNYLNDVELIAYSLTADSFHLVLYQKTRGSIERFLRSLCTRYSMYFNKKYHRSGSLFAGPYKSFPIKDVNELPQLTGNLHRSSDYSSYPEYLGSRNTEWIKPQIVLSNFKGTDDYKNFVEKYQDDQKGEQLARTPEGRDPTSEPNLPTRKDLKVRSKMPQFLAISTLGFVILVAISVRNITISKALSYQSQLTPAILSETTTTEPSPTPEATQAATLEATAKSDLATISAKPETLRVSISDGSSFVNIRQKPSLSSEKIARAGDDEIFEFISLQAGWYEIKLTDESTGFISAKYAVKEESN